MGLDVGSRTVGVAVSDLLGWTAQGIEIIRINEEEENFGFERLGELVKEYEVTKFVVGLPKNMNNSIGPELKHPWHMVIRFKNYFNYLLTIKMND